MSAEDKTDVAAAASSASTSDTSEDLDVFVKELMDNSKIFASFLPFVFCLSFAGSAYIFMFRYSPAVVRGSPARDGSLSFEKLLDDPTP